ncbi:signal transduction histidine kinase, partial [Candidatus Gastranaerophilus sp. (ex Termes propinquus)]
MILKYIKLAEENAQVHAYLKKAASTISAVRWGNLQERIVQDTKSESLKTLTEGLNSLFESISDRERMIQEYIEREKELAGLKSDFIATLTHDLKVPIIAQDNTFDLFLNEAFGEITQVQEQALRNLKASNIDLKHLIEALLETYKMEVAG